MRVEGHIAIAGAGYVGLTSAACFCEVGHRVKLVDLDQARVAQLQAGGCPIYEPGLSELLRRHLGAGLEVTTDLMAAVAGARALFVCVGTPQQETGAPDLRALKRLLRDLRRLPDIEQTVLVLKSTVPPGTCRFAHESLQGRLTVVSNPEFLREGTAIHDFFHPDRVVVGSPDEGAALMVAGLYGGVDAPLLVTGWEEAELIKYATNTFLALKISFANEIAALCDGVGGDALDVLKGLGLDHRVGQQFLQPGPGYGGSCLPKDVRALAWRGRRAGVRMELAMAAERANRRQRERLLARLTDGLGGDLAGKRIAVWGLAFKAGTDDLRGAASVELIPQLLAKGAQVRAYDPAALPGFARLAKGDRWSNLLLVEELWAAIQGADALLILTEWEQFRKAAPLKIRRRMAGRLVVDARNLLDPDLAAGAGLHYWGIGRGRSRRG